MVNVEKTVIPKGSQRGMYSKLSPPFSDAVNYYLSLTDLKARLSESSLKRTASCGTTLLYFFQQKGFKSFSDVNETDLIPFFVKEDKPCYETSSRVRMSEFLTAIADKYPECESISKWIPHIRVTRKNIQYLTEEETQAVKEACTSDNHSLSYCDRAVGILLLYTGLRACDIAGLTMDSIDWENEKIHVVQKKTAVPLTLPLLVVVGNAIYDYIKSERISETDSLFVTINGNPFKSSDVSYCVKKIFKSANIRQNKGDRQGTHIFRHRVATRLLENKVAQPVISQTLGHTDPVSVQAYLSADLKHLKECSLSIEDYALDWEVFDHA